jgi:hypothetical protein
VRAAAAAAAAAALTPCARRYYSDLAGPENFEKYQDFIYLAGSASAEFIADVALCPFEAVKARRRTRPPALSAKRPAG